MVRDALETGRAADVLDVHDDDADDLAEAQRRDGKVVAAQAQRRDADEEAEEAGGNAACNQGHGERHVEVSRQDDADIGADGHEAGVAERELARVAIDEVEARGQDDVDADDQEVELPERAQDALRDQELQDCEQDDREDEHDAVILA